MRCNYIDDLTALICKCCGGQIDRATLTCKSCGTQYKQKTNGVLEIISAPRPIRFISNAVIIPRFMVDTDPQKAMEYGLKQLAERLAEQILPLADWVQEYNPKDNSYYLDMRVGVVEPRNPHSNIFSD